MVLISGEPLLWHIVERLRRSKEIDEIVIATSIAKKDDVITDYLTGKGVACFRGNESDVLERFWMAAKQHKADNVVRICADCPLIDPFEIDKMVQLIKESGVDYVHNKHKKGTPFGTGGEVMTINALEKAHKNSSSNWHREHVTTYIKDHPQIFKIVEYDAPAEKFDPVIRLVIDYEADLTLIREIYRNLYKKDAIIELEKVIKFLKENPDLRSSNFNYRE